VCRRPWPSSGPSGVSSVRRSSRFSSCGSRISRGSPARRPCS
jgi:hypothetical protein